MKARIKATGEIVEVKMHYPEFERPYFTLIDLDGVTRFSTEDLEPAEPDWQQVHIQAAIAAMQGMIANQQTFEQLDHDKGYQEVRGGDKSQIIAIASIMYADALVAELQKKYE